MITVVTWKWRSIARPYTFYHVNVLHEMLTRHVTVPWRHVCVTDDPFGINPSITTIPLWEDPVVNLKEHKLNSYRRLKMFSDEAKELFGERILSLDLDTIICGNIDHLLKRQEDFIAWYKGLLPYQGGIILHRTGTRTYLWDEFDPIWSPIKSAKYPGTDQAWMSHRLPPDETIWTKNDGIYSYKQDLAFHKALPEDVCIVMFHGTPKPWQLKEKWVLEHYKM